MNFLNQIKSSIYNPQFYKDLEHQPVSFSIKYFIKLVFCASFLSLLIIGIFNKSFFSNTKTLIEKGFDTIPEDLEININNSSGIIESNKKEPYFLNENAIINNNGNIKKLDSSHLLFVNTNIDFSVNALNESNSVVSVFRDSIAFYNPKDQNIRIYKATDLPDLKISKSEVLKWKNKFFKFWPLIVVLLNLIMFFGLIISSFKYLILGVVFGLILMFLLRIKNNKVSFKYSFKIAIHLFTISIIFSIIEESFFVYGFGSSYGYFSILSFITILNLKDFGKQENLNSENPGSSV